MRSFGAVCAACGKSLRLAAVVCVAAFLVTCCDAGGGDGDGQSGVADGWFAYVVDSKKDVGLYTSIALDGTGRIFISYYMFNIGYLDPDLSEVSYYVRYAYRDSGGWHVDTVSQAGFEAADTHIAVDSRGNPHINWCSSGAVYKDAVMYAVRSSGSWEIVAIEENTGTSEHYDTYLALDSRDNAHITYHCRGDLKYATNASGKWRIYTIDATDDDEGGHPALAFDPEGNIHMCYWSSTRGDLMYATNAYGDWEIFTVDSDGEVGKYADIAVDSHGFAHISYFDLTNAHLKYATNAGGFWSIFVPDDSYGAGMFTSIAVAPDDSVHIAYFDGRNSVLKYATNAYGDWTVLTIDSRGNTGLFPSIAVDSSGCVHISYMNDSTDDLMYATNCLP